MSLELKAALKCPFLLLLCGPAVNNHKFCVLNMFLLMAGLSCTCRNKTEILHINCCPCILLQVLMQSSRGKLFEGLKGVRC